MKVLLELLKNGGDVGAAAKSAAKKYALIGGGCFLLVVFMAVCQQAMINSALCNKITSWFGSAIVECPTPPVDDEALKDLGDKLHDERKKEWEKLTNQTSNQRFQTIEEVMQSQNQEEAADLNYDEAEYFLRVMLTVDLNAYSTYVKDKDLKKGGLLKGSSIDKSLKFAKELYNDEFRHWLQTDKKSKKGFNKGKLDYLMAFRVKTYGCFLLGECGGSTFWGKVSNLWEEEKWEEKYEISMGIDDLGEKEKEEYKGVAIKTVKDDEGNKNFVYKTKQEILDLFCEISFFQTLEEAGVVGDGNTLCQDAMQSALEGYTDYYSLNNSTAGASFGWLVPMEDGTYNFSSPYGPRWGKMHNGVDMGTLGVADVPIYATKSGTVEFAGWNNGGYGGVVTIDHGNGYYSMYAHMETKDIVVKTGQTVQQGQLIGAVDGQPNLALHLHFEICTSVTNGSGQDLNGDAGSVICKERVDPENKEFAMTFNKSQDVALSKERANSFVKEWKSQALNGEVVIMPGYSPRHLGWIAAAYESSGDPGVCVMWDQKRGGLSCGTHQFASTTRDDFINNYLKNHYPEYYARFKGLPMTMEGVGAAWAKLYADDPSFADVQWSYLYEKNYLPIAKKIYDEFGFDVNVHEAFMEQCWSMAMQWNNSTIKIWRDSGVGANWRNYDHETILRKIYQGADDRYYNNHGDRLPRFKQEVEDFVDVLYDRFTEHHKYK